MRKDPAIDEVRKVRKEISQEYDSTKGFLDHYRAMEKSYEARMLRTGKALTKEPTKASG